MKKRLSILGSTGSIGVNTLEVVTQLKDDFDIIYLSTNKNTDLLLQQIDEFDPKAVSVADETSTTEGELTMEEKGK